MTELKVVNISQLVDYTEEEVDLSHLNSKQRNAIFRLSEQSYRRGFQQGAYSEVKDEEELWAFRYEKTLGLAFSAPDKHGSPITCNHPTTLEERVKMESEGFINWGLTQDE